MSEFERGKKLGSGTYGNVYEIKVKGKEKPQALKEMYYDGNPISGFGNLREIEILSKVSKNCHFIPKILFLHRTSYKYKPFKMKEDEIRTEFISFSCEKANFNGTDYFAKTEAYSAKTALKLSMELLLAVSHIHRYEIFHRDIKPGNVLIYLDEYKTPTLKLCDFGFATYNCNTVKRSPKIITELYRSPEVMLRVRNYKMNADVWSVGCTIYEIFTGDMLIKGCKDPDENPELFMETCLRLIPNEWTIESQEVYRRNSKYKNDLVINGKRKSTKMPKSCDSFMSRFQKSGRYNNSDYRYWEYADLLLKDCLNFSYRERMGPSSILEQNYFSEFREDIKRELEYQYDEIIYDAIYIEISDELQAAKEEYFFEAYEKLSNEISPRIFFHAVDLANSFLTTYPDSKYNINNIFGACMYFFNVYFNVVNYAEDVITFFFKSYTLEQLLTEEIYKEIDRFVFDFEKLVIDKEKWIGLNSYRDVVFEMQDQFDHILSDSEVELLFYEFVKVNNWVDRRSYRHMYRVLTNKLFGINFS